MEASTAEQLAAEAVENGSANGADAAEPKGFSMELTQDQKDIQEWVHGFAEGVMRPAASRHRIASARRIPDSPPRRP